MEQDKTEIGNSSQATERQDPHRPQPWGSTRKSKSEPDMMLMIQSSSESNRYEPPSSTEKWLFYHGIILALALLYGIIASFF